MAVKGTTITDLADDVAGKTSRAARKAGAKASEVIVEVKEDVSAFAGKAGTGAYSAASTGKDYAAEAVHGLAGVARDVASKLDDGKADSGNAKAAEFARKAADGMDRFSASLKDKEINEIAEDARSAVRNNPAIAVGAAAVIGFALARFLKGGSDD
jgi:ElaB/YqjD/DUF883 family membrane-anchored ribosome-binding protein